MKKLITIVLIAHLGGCAVNRGETISPCEYEQWKVGPVEFWRSSNCVAQEGDTHFHKVMERNRELLNGEPEGEEPVEE